MSVRQLIGIDLDNTLVSYDDAFHRAALERGLIPAGLASWKNAVRDFVRKKVSNEAWTELQGDVYGTRMAEAKMFPGVSEFFRICQKRQRDIVIISHKSQYPARGPRYNLRAAALAWLCQTGLLGGEHSSSVKVLFAETRSEKIRLIGQCRCSEFIDDLPEVFSEPEFPIGVEKVLFDPNDNFPNFEGGRRVSSWPDITQALFSHEFVRAAD